MTNKQEVETLKAKIVELEIRLAALELRKTDVVYIPVYQPVYQQPWPYYTSPWYTISGGTTGTGNSSITVS